MINRRERIEAMLADEPADVFLRYSLAMELDKEADHDRSLELLAILSHETPAYVPAFFMSAQQLARLNRVNEARSMLRDGIEVARQQGDSHAAGEMGEFLASLASRGVLSCPSSPLSRPVYWPRPGSWTSRLSGEHSWQFS